MHQILVEIPIPFTNSHLPIFGFGLMLCFGFFAASWLIHQLARRDGLDADRVTDLVLWGFVWGVIGARTLYMIRNPTLFENPLNFFKIWQGGIVFYGGVITCIPVFILYCRRYGLPPWRVLDIIAPGIALGIGIGRFGCLLNGCCWGKHTTLPWGIRFPAESIPWQEQLRDSLITADAPYSLAVHPTQVYLALAGWLMLVLTLAYMPYRRRNGEVMAVLMLVYAATRFGIEFLRADEPLLSDGLTMSQNISIALLAGCVVLWTWLRRTPQLIPAIHASVQPAAH